jgi:hypothetical protein
MKVGATKNAAKIRRAESRDDLVSLTILVGLLQNRLCNGVTFVFIGRMRQD